MLGQRVRDAMGFLHHLDQGIRDRCDLVGALGADDGMTEHAVRHGPLHPGQGREDALDVLGQLRGCGLRPDNAALSLAMGDLRTCF
jgi:hypothetical protein